jgi:hypothetical protein
MEQSVSVGSWLSLGRPLRARDQPSGGLPLAEASRRVGSAFGAKTRAGAAAAGGRVGGRRLCRMGLPTGLFPPAADIESGRGQACPGPSHTTRHAGPHRAVRSASPDTAVGVGEPFQASRLVPVGVWQRALEWPGSGDGASIPSGRPRMSGRPGRGYRARGGSGRAFFGASTPSSAPV